MHVLTPSPVTAQRAGVAPRLIATAYLSFTLVLSTTHASFAATETKTFVAFSMKAAQTKIENSIRAGENFRRARLDLYQLGGITKPLAVVLDKDTGDWIIVGERDVNSSILTLDDWAVALRARFLHPGDDDPGVTIDPQPLDPSAKLGMAGKWAEHQKVRFFGGVENTHFGMVCFDSDWLMKRISFGIDKLNADGLETYYDLLSKEQKGTELAGYNVASRFWFLPIVNRVNVLGDVVLLEKFKMGVFTEVMYAEVNGKPVVDLDHFQNAASEGFSRSFSDHYDAAARAREVLETLRGLTRLAGLAKGLVQADNKPNLSYWLYRFPVAKVDTPDHTDVLSVENRPQGWKLSGGVQLAALAARFKGGDAQALKQLVLGARPQPDSFTWRFDLELKDGQPISVVLPNTFGDPDRVAALASHAWFLYQKKRYQDALEGLDAAFGQSPELSADASWAKGIVMRAYALLGQGSQSQADERLRQAVSLFEKSIGSNPHFASGQYELGVTLRALGDYRRAIACFQKTLEADQNYTPAYFGLGLATASAGDPRGAIEYLKQFIERNPTGSYSDDARSEIKRLQTRVEAPRRQLKTYTLTGAGLSLRYPDDWLVMTPEEVTNRAAGNMFLTADCVLVVANPDNWGQNVNIQITDAPGYDSLSPESLKSFAQGMPREMGKEMQGFRELSHRIIEVDGVPALEFNCSSLAWDKRQRQRVVAFVKHEKLYIVTCTALEGEFSDAEAKAFQFIIDTLDTTAK